VFQEDEFSCRLSDMKVCIPATLRCNYHPDCPQGEDEDGCGELRVHRLTRAFAILSAEQCLTIMITCDSLPGY